MTNAFSRLGNWLIYGNRGRNFIYTIVGLIAIVIIVALVVFDLIL